MQLAVAPEDNVGGETLYAKVFLDGLLLVLGIGDGTALARLTNFNIDFGDGETTTGIISIENGQLTIDNSAGGWYSLDGRRLDSKPTKKGVYINNGKKTVIK